MSATVEIRREGHVGELAFHNPPHNYATVELLRSLAEGLEAFDADTEVRAVVLRSEGKAFSAGAELGRADGIGGVSADPVREFYDQAIRLFGSKKPIVAAIQGAAIGAGLGLAMAADFRVASPEARFSANFIKIGYHPGFGLTHTLPRAIGAQRAALMFLTADRFKAEEVLPWGLVDQLVDAADLVEATWALARRIAENAPLSLLAARETLRPDLQAAVRAALVPEYAKQSVLRETEDYAEGVRAVAERRPGKFVSR